MKRKTKLEMKPFGWHRDRWRCDFCDRRISDRRVKLTHSSGPVFYACIPCGLKALLGGANRNALASCSSV